MAAGSNPFMLREMHLMSASCFVRPLTCLIALWGLFFLSLTPAFATEPPRDPLHVVLVSGSLEYKSDRTLAALQEELERDYHAICSRAFYNEIDDLPGLESLDDCDVMLLFTRRMKLSGDQLDRIKRYALAGRPIVGVRTASHAIQSWLEFDREVLGGNYRGHYGNEHKTHIEVLDEAADHPTLVGFEPFVSEGSLYRNRGVADDVNVLMQGRLATGEVEPITWTRQYRDARVFYTSLGHPDDFDQAGFRQMLINALFWVAERDVQPTSASATAD